MPCWALPGTWYSTNHFCCQQRIYSCLMRECHWANSTLIWRIKNTRYCMEMCSISIPKKYLTANIWESSTEEEIMFSNFEKWWPKYSFFLGLGAGTDWKKARQKPGQAEQRLSSLANQGMESPLKNLVVNISSPSLSDTKFAVLNNGLSYCPSSKMDWFHL